MAEHGDLEFSIKTKIMSCALIILCKESEFWFSSRRKCVSTVLDEDKPVHFRNCQCKCYHTVDILQLQNCQCISVGHTNRL